MEVKEIMLLKAFEGIDMLLSKGQINDTYIQLLYFIKNLNEDNNLVIGLSDNEIEDLLDEDSVKTDLLSEEDELFEKLQRLLNLQDLKKVSIFILKEPSSEEIDDPMVKIWEESIKKLPQLWED